MDYEPQSGITPFGVEFIVRGPPGRSVAVDVQLMNDSGPHNVSACPALTLNEDGEGRIPLLGPLADGAYIALLRSAPAGAFTASEQNPRNWAAFEIVDGEARAPENPSAIIDEAVARQFAFQNHEVRAQGFAADNRLQLHIIVEGCELDYAQPFQGGRLQPLAQRVGPESLVAVVNALIQAGPVFSAAALRETYSQSRPLCLVTFSNVQAPELGAAVEAVQSRLERVLGALAEDRSSTPQVLAYLSENAVGQLTLTFPHEGYRGNRVPGFGPGVTGLLDSIEAAAEADPWIDFALGLMRSIRLQTNLDTQLFQSWSLIEAAAKRTIPRDPSQPVLDDSGQQILTSRGPQNQGHDLGRVTVYLRDHVGRSCLLQPTIASSFYDGLRELYEARNRIAHEAGLSAPGAPLPNTPAWQLAFTAKEIASQVLRYEIRRAAFDGQH